jgi:hypothetical protein
MRTEESWERSGGSAVRGSPVGSGSATRPRTVKVRRVCAHDGCETVLSCYNSRQLCWQHDPGGQYILRVHDRRREAGSPEVFPAA